MTTLRPEDRISHYRIRGPLGVGGMGEVYAALDETLERSVALKILPPRLLRSEERVRRFVTEAKSASSLNHPNIVTIYEIGQSQVQPGAPPEGSASPEEGEGPSAVPLHFISMELIEGVTLTHKIHDEAEDLRTLVGYISQAAEGVARAHVSGIVHRDLKPGNIMVSRDGQVKVLDFGLAKLIERQPAAGEMMTNVPTEEVNTREGAVVGTVGYMSPEQVLGKPADPRSDIFAMGCILYEAATRRRPFVADTDVEVMHQILRERPAPVEEINGAVPGELRRLIRRCLSKQPDERIQSMKDLAVDLREVAESWDSLQTSSGASRTLPRPAEIPASASRRRMVVGLAGVAGVVALVAIALWLPGARPGAPEAPGGPMTPRLLMSRNDLLQAVLSGDGRYLAYVGATGDLTSLNVRQVHTGSEVQVLPAQEFSINGLSFSPDGDYLYYLNRDPNLPNYQALYQVASLGGAPRRVAFDVDTAVTFGPGGRELCFRRGRIDEHADALVILDSATGRERELFRVNEPEAFGSPGGSGAPAWSPDGKRIAVPVFTVQGSARTRVVTLDAVTGLRADLGRSDWLFIESLAWLPDGSGLVLSALVLGSGRDAYQLYRLSYPAGEAHKLTNDLNGFENVSLSTDGKSLAAVRQTRVANVWIVSAEKGGEPHPITFGSGSAASVDFIEPLPDGGVAFANVQGDRYLLWRMDADGSRPRTLNTDGYVVNMDFAEKAGIVFTQAGDDSVLHIWRVGADGTGLRQITNGPGEQLLDLSPDGTKFLFGRFDDLTHALSMSLEGGEPRAVVGSVVGGIPIYSPDGRRLLHTTLEATGGAFYPRRVVVPAEGGEPLATFKLPPGAENLNWAPDGEGVTYIDRATGFNLMRRPIAKEGAEQLTRFTEGRLRGHGWSPDGRKVLLLRHNGREESLWVLEPGTAAAPVKLVEFKTGRIFRVAWARDSRSVFFIYGELGQDVVLLREAV